MGPIPDRASASRTIRFGDGKWAIRGGYGIFFEHMNGQTRPTAEALQFSPVTADSKTAGVRPSWDGYDQVGARFLRQFQYRRTA